MAAVSDIVIGNSSPILQNKRNASEDPSLTFSLLPIDSEGGESLADFICDNNTQFSEWVDGFNMLLDKNISNKITADLIGQLTEIGVKICLLDLTGEKVDIPGTVPEVPEFPTVMKFYYDDRRLSVPVAAHPESSSLDLRTKIKDSDGGDNIGDSTVGDHGTGGNNNDVGENKDVTSVSFNSSFYSTRMGSFALKPASLPLSSSDSDSKFNDLIIESSQNQNLMMKSKEDNFSKSYPSSMNVIPSIPSATHRTMDPDKDTFKLLRLGQDSDSEKAYPDNKEKENSSQNENGDMESDTESTPLPREHVHKIQPMPLEDRLGLSAP